MNLTTSHFSTCFRKAFELASSGLKKIVASRYLAILKNEDEDYISKYESAFFRATDMNYLSRKERPLVIKHLMQTMRQHINIPMLSSIGKFLQKSDATEFVDIITREILSAVKSQDNQRINALRSFANTEFTISNKDFLETVSKRLNDWVVHFEKKKDNESGVLIENLRNSAKFYLNLLYDV
jgi:hypothetical protein